MKINILGVPIYHGCTIKGVEDAPQAFRENKIFQELENRFNISDLGNVEMIQTIEEKIYDEERNIKYPDIIEDTCQKVYKKVHDSVKEGAFTIVIGGDHTIATGSIAGAAIANNYEMGVVWVDAYSDLNTPITSVTKNFNTMPLATSLYVGKKELRAIGEDRRKVKPSDTFLVGVREMDASEVELKDSQGINHHTIAFIQKRGMSVVANEILDSLSRNGIKKIHFSLDLRAMTPEIIGNCTCTPKSDGINAEEMISFVKYMFASGRICSMDIAEYNPKLDNDGKGMKFIKQIIDTIADYMPRI